MYTYTSSLFQVWSFRYRSLLHLSGPFKCDNLQNLKWQKSYSPHIVLCDPLATAERLVSEFWCYSQRFTGNQDKPMKGDTYAILTNQRPAIQDGDGNWVYPHPRPIRRYFKPAKHQSYKRNGHSSLKRLHNLNPQANILIDESFMRLKSWNYEKLPNYDPQQQLSSLFSHVLKAAGAGGRELRSFSTFLSL